MSGLKAANPVAVSESDILQFLHQIESGDITLVPDRDPQDQIKGDILFRASNGWTIEVSNWNGEFAGIVELGLPDGNVLDVEYLDLHMPAVAQYFPDQEVAWRAYRMKAVEAGFLYLSNDKPGRFADAKDGMVVSNPTREPPWIVVDRSLHDVNVARWPGRLWLAQVIDRLEPQDHRGTYTRCISVKIVREMETHLLFGAHGRAVEQVLAYAGSLTLEKAERLSARRHAEAKDLQSAGWHRWMADAQRRAIPGDRDMAGVVAAGQVQPRSPIGYGLSLAHSCAWDAAVREAGDAALEEDEEESWLVSPWSEAASVMLDTAWALGAPQYFNADEQAILLEGWNGRLPE